MPPPKKSPRRCAAHVAPTHQLDSQGARATPPLPFRTRPSADRAPDHSDPPLTHTHPEPWRARAPCARSAPRSWPLARAGGAAAAARAPSSRACCSTSARPRTSWAAWRPRAVRARPSSVGRWRGPIDPLGVREGPWRLRIVLFCGGLLSPQHLPSHPLPPIPPACPRPVDPRTPQARPRPLCPRLGAAPFRLRPCSRRTCEFRALDIFFFSFLLPRAQLLPQTCRAWAPARPPGARPIHPLLSRTRRAPRASRPPGSAGRPCGQ